ncbi:MAG: apolipoprotein N-acyltransferase, partial [Alkalispirochaeta sp.]
VAEAILATGERTSRGRPVIAPPLRRHLPASGYWVLVAVVTLVASHGVGALLLMQDLPVRDTVRMALVQQNSDPRKHDYDETLDALQRITDDTVQHDPDLIVWSETAFVPNIRRWSQEDPDRYRLARLVREFTAYQESLGRWLVTGNDDYRRVLDEDGNEVERHSYNAAVLFSDTGERRETYHKIRLVPFTEHFPYENQFPWVYSMLQDFDIAFWTPGEERTIFHHPQVRFATPICFEDVFPQEVRRFALNGMEVIVNLTNDYWSLQETAAQQHFAAALFRTVELRRPMVRATASGVTSHVDARGTIIGTTPQYSEQYLIADVEVPASDDEAEDAVRGPMTLYMRWGDWVPYGSILVVILLALRGVRSRKE